MRFIYFFTKILTCYLSCQVLFINGSDQAFVQLQLRITEPFYLTQVTFNSDINFSAAEFDYLTDLKAGMQVDATSLQQACFCLAQRKIFARILVAITNDLKFGKKVHFNLVGYPCLGRLKIEGVLFGKEHYCRLYGLEYGAKFEYSKHKTALNKILNYLRNDGYLKARLHTKINFDARTKKVDIDLKINTGSRFKIASVSAGLHAADSKLFNKVDLHGLQYKVEQLLEDNLIGEYYTSALLRKELAGLKKYLARNGYPFSQISFTILKNKATSKIQISVNIFLKEELLYSFAGNNFYSRHDLIDYIMFSGDPIWHLPIALVEKDLIDLYAKNGFWRASITGEQAINKYHFAICEGVRAKIKQVVIEGLDCDERALILNNFFKKKVIGKFYHKKNFEEVLEKLSDWYVQRGFWDFRILNIDFKCLNESNQSYELVLICHKGACRFLKSASVLNYPDIKIPAYLTAYKQFKIKDLQPQKSWLCHYFKQYGHNYVSAYPKLKEHEHKQEQGIDVDIVWDVQIPEQNIIGKTIRRGNADISFNKLYQNLPYQAGDLWDQEKLEKALFRIKSWDAFDAVRLYPLGETDPLGRKPIVLDLNLDHKLEIRTRLGFQKVSKNFVFKAGTTYKIGMSALYKNVTSCGDQFRFDADLTKYYRSIVLQYKRPIFINIPFYFIAKTYTNKYDQPIFIGSKYRLYNVLQQGGLVDLGYKGLALSVDFNLGIEGIEVSNISHEYARAIDFSDKLLCKQLPFLFMEQTLLIDRLDDKLNPRSGLLTLATGKAMFAISQTENYFFKFLLEQSVFLPVFSESVFAMRLRLGHIFTNDFSVIMPIERFYLGGTYSLRSYEPDMAPPLGRAILDKNNSQTNTCKKSGQPDPQKTSDSTSQRSGCAQGYGGQAMVSDKPSPLMVSDFVEIVSNPEREHQRFIWLPQGGKSMINISFEFRFPIYQNLGGVIFEDLGTLLKSGENLGQNSLLTGTGFGLRYHTPIGPLRFDIAWRPRNFAWFLTVGHAF